MFARGKHTADPSLVAIIEQQQETIKRLQATVIELNAEINRMNGLPELPPETGVAKFVHGPIHLVLLARTSAAAKSIANHVSRRVTGNRCGFEQTVEDLRP